MVCNTQMATPTEVARCLFVSVLSDQRVALVDRTFALDLLRLGRIFGIAGPQRSGNTSHDLYSVRYNKIHRKVIFLKKILV